MPTSFIVFCAAFSYFGVRLACFVLRVVRKREVTNQISSIVNAHVLILHLVIGVDMVSDTKDTLVGLALVGFGIFHLMLLLADLISHACHRQIPSGTRYVVGE